MKIQVYHIARRNDRESILRDGLIPKSKETGRIQYGPRIHFSTNRENLGYDYVDYENVDCWGFKIEEELITRDTNSHSEFHYFAECPIAPEELTLVESIGAFPRI